VGLSGRGRRRRRGAAVGVVRSGRHRASRVEQETERKDGRAGAFGWDGLLGLLGEGTGGGPAIFLIFIS
jgi:hypothetical protein